MRQKVSILWSNLFMDSSNYPESPDEAAWLDLLVSEPALLESSLAIGTRHNASDRMCGQDAETHSIRAVNMLLQRIKTGQAHMDAVLAVVMTMAFGERLARNDAAWNVHIDGLTQLVKERYAQGVPNLPSWFIGLLISFVKSFLLLRD